MTEGLVTEGKMKCPSCGSPRVTHTLVSYADTLDCNRAHCDECKAVGELWQWKLPHHHDWAGWVKLAKDIVQCEEVLALRQCPPGNSRSYQTSRGRLTIVDHPIDPQTIAALREPVGLEVEYEQP